MKIMIRGIAVTVFSVLLVPFGAYAQDSSILVQCPTSTRLHPNGNGIECKHIAAGDGMVSMAKFITDPDKGPIRKPLYVFGFSKINLPGEDGAPLQDSGLYPGYVMDQGLMAANAPAPTIEVNEDDEVFLSLTNVGMAMRPDLFDPHTIHWHGFPNASAVFDGLPESGISIAGGATLTYYYNAKDAGTYMYHCHVEATEHMQMGMLGSLFVRPRQDKADPTKTLYDEFTRNYANINNGGYTAPPVADNGVMNLQDDHYTHYAFNDGDGSTRYDSDVAIQFGSFDPDFHDLHLAVQPLPFAAMRDRYFLMNGRGYPDTVLSSIPDTVDPLDLPHASQPISTLITGAPGDRILLRLSNLSVTAFYTVGTSGLPMEVVGLDARLLRDDDGNNMSYMTNSVTLGGGQSADVIISIPNDPTYSGKTFFLYTKNLDLLANDDENFGGMMTEIQIN